MQPTITLRQVWRDYSDTHTLKNKTVRDANCKLKHVADWMDMDLKLINKEMVLSRHKLISANAPTQANHTLRLLNRLINFAIYRYEEEDGKPLIERNPVQYLNQARAWNRERARTRHIPLHKIRDWFFAVLLLPYPTIRDYLIVCLLTGMRSTEVASLKWEYIDWEGGFINLPQTKNGEPHCLPMSTYLRELFNERFQSRRSDQFVFPGGKGKGSKGRPRVEGAQIGYMASADKGIYLVRQQSGVKFSSHDLRRTFNLLAEDLDIDEFTRKRLLNHTPQDVTGRHYSVKNPEKLRKPMERISEHVLNLSGLSNAVGGGAG